VADVDGVLEVELLDDSCQVVGIGVEVVAFPRLARAAMTATVSCDTAIAPLGEEKHLVLERIRGEWPPVAEDDGLTLTPVLVIDLGAVLRDHCSHGFRSFETFE